ncbi:hypothetical protein ACIRPX_05170 [Streptomyces sp. NPDC101225]|uniref:hypothetical protein n=1 Tax=Streptomyces sp. NPDC101225 TaxID=3366135 RepID=UPI003816E32E
MTAYDAADVPPDGHAVDPVVGLLGPIAPQDVDLLADDDGRSPAPWPALPPEAFYGLPGEIVQAIEPHTEADPAAMLFTLYAAAGAMIGHRPHVLTGGVEHGAKVWPLIIGRTAGGVKGTSWAEVRRVLRAADSLFVASHVMGGLSSAEGLIYQVRDSEGDDPDGDHFDPGVADKRLLIVESEFASVLAQGKRDGNTLLPLVRQAWDGGSLRTMTVRSKVATDPHIVIIGHITPTELRMKLAESERAGGTMNRFLPVLSRRSKLLPDGGNLADGDLKALGASLASVIAQAATVGRMVRTVEAAEYWQDLYGRLAGDHMDDGQVAQVVARAAPQVLRMSVTAALLCGERRIDLPHLQAAEAMWSYVEESAWHVFGSMSGNPDLERIKSFVDAAGTQGVTRDEIRIKCFGKHKKKRELDQLVSELLPLGYEVTERRGRGRPAMVLRRVPRT